MFERYTEKARRTIFFARYEASQFGSPYIESEHLLLGLLRENKALAARFLRSHASVESIRKQIEEHTTIREKVSTSVDLPISNECKRILAYAAEEADQLSHRSIGTEHLFLGMLREQGCFAAQLLTERGISLESAREQIGKGPLEQLGTSLKSPGLPAGYAPHKLLYNAAAGTLIVEMHRPGGILPSRLFMRRRDADAYEPIASPSDDVSCESLVTSEKYPLVVFNALRSKAGGAGVWDGVYRFDLISKELTICISREKLQFSEPHGRLWIVDLVSLSEDARAVYVIIGIEKEVSGGGVAHYHLAKVDFVDQEVKLLSRLVDFLA